MKKILFIFPLFMVMTSLAYAEVPTDFKVITGKPDTMTESWPGSVKRFDLSIQEQEAKRLTIIRQTDEVIWQSNKNAPMAHLPAGLYDNFVSLTVPGYVKISIGKEGCEYMEHHHQDFGTLTYYGKCEIK